MEQIQTDLGKAMCIAIGLKIFAKHGYHDVSAEHDELYAGSALEVEEVYLVESLGWRWQKEHYCWAIFTQP